MLNSMENTNINEENMIEASLDRAHRELDVLYEVSCAMRTTLELNHILYVILTGVTSHPGLGYNRALLFLANPKTHQLECKMAIGPESGEHANKIWRYIEASHQNLDDLIQTDKIAQVINESALFKSLKDLKIPLQSETSCLLATAYEKGQPWHVPPEVISQYSNDPLFRIFQSQELVIIPLKIKDAVIGLIIADNIFTQKPITPEDIKIFTMLADQAALAIENSRLYEMVVQKSLTDPVTDLWNHRFFQEKLSEEMTRAYESKRSLSLAMIDIDNFKSFNDTYGHQHGDKILREMAMILKECSREKDHLCRYGGEEFAIIFVETNKIQGLEIAERLRKRIAGHPFSSLDGQQPLKLTVSVGVASFPEDTDVKEKLIAFADKAMYIAKFSGKNQTCTIPPDQTH
jgi:diguanylate cyclase (GGDEF)-like protein